MKLSPIPPSRIHYTNECTDNFLLFFSFHNIAVHHPLAYPENTIFSLGWVRKKKHTQTYKGIIMIVDFVKRAESRG